MIIQNGVGITTLLNSNTVKQTLNPANETVGKGIYNATTLSAVDADLATANIKNGITMFGFAGSADVQDISDATAIEAEVLSPETFYAVSGGIRTGTMATRTLNPANEVVQAGYYAATTLSAVDVQLAAANILSGVVIFGFTGVATVQDIADADAVLSDVKNGKTFYSVTGGRKTGNLATVALAAGANAYPAGYHVGAASLTAVDADLATGNIKSGVTIFGVAGHVDVRNVSDANALVSEVKTGRTFYAVGGARKTGTMPTVALAPGANAYPAGYHAGAASLTAVDGDLAAGNIADGITIFGVLGTFTGGALVEDLTQVGKTASRTRTGFQEKDYYSHDVSAGSDLDIISITPTFAAGSMAVVSTTVAVLQLEVTNMISLRLYAGGVQIAESPNFLWTLWFAALVATRALSGAQICKVAFHNYDSVQRFVYVYIGNDPMVEAIAVMVGSVKT